MQIEELQSALFIQDCHIHLFRVEVSSNIWILGKTGQVMCKLEDFHSWRDTELHRTLTALPFNRTFSLSLIVTFFWLNRFVSAHLMRNMDDSYKTWYFLFPTDGAKTVAKFYTVAMFRVRLLSYTLTLDQIKQCILELDTTVNFLFRTYDISANSIIIRIFQQHVFRIVFIQSSYICQLYYKLYIMKHLQFKNTQPQKDLFVE